MISSYFHIGIYIKGRKKPMKGVRQYHTNNVDDVYNTVLSNTLKYYLQSDIQKIDVWILPEDTPEVQVYLAQSNSVG